MLRSPSKKQRSLLAWSEQKTSSFYEYVETIVVIAMVTVLGLVLVPNASHLTLGLVYLLAVIVLSLRVGRRPVLIAGVLSAMTWDYLIIPPHFSFVVGSFEDGMMLGTYCVVALVAGQLTARVRAQELNERLREQRATALFHLTRALAATRTLDEAATAFLRQVDEVFNATTALLFTAADDTLAAHPTHSYPLQDTELNIADWVKSHRREAGRFTRIFPSAKAFYLPLMQKDGCRGVFVLCPATEEATLSPVQRELIEDFAAQISLMVQHERFRIAIERERILARSEELYRALFDSVSHELKSPLAVLNAAIEKLNTKSETARDDLLPEIRTAVRRLTRLVNNLLNQTRLEAGVLRSRVDWCNPRDIVNAALRQIHETLAPEKPIAIHLPADLPLLRADAALLEQIVFNLLHNAVSHTPPGTEISVSAGVTDERVQRVFITIADRGPGLPAERRDNPFQKFRRSAATRSGGLGLGLSIARGYALAQGGELEARENSGGGARFTVYLPHVAHGKVPLE